MRAPPVDGHRRLEPTRRKPASGSSASVDFSRHLHPAPGADVAETGAAEPLAGLAALLDIQEIAADPGDARDGARRHGEELIDRLEVLHLDLLSGRVSAGRLQHLAAVLGEERPTSGDLRLDALVGEIRLRAEVELAKLEKAG